MIHPTASEKNEPAGQQSDFPRADDFDDDDFSINSAMVEEFKCQ